MGMAIRLEEEQGMSGRTSCHLTIGDVAGVILLECGWLDQLRLLTRWGRVELRRQGLRARDNPCNVRVFASPRGGIRSTFLGFEPTSVFILPPLLSGFFLCPLLKARP